MSIRALYATGDLACQAPGLAPPPVACDNVPMLAHVDMDAFYAAVETLDQPALRGKPLVVGMGKRGVVAACSYEARKFGIRSAMPIFEAKRRCPGAIFLPVRMARYQEISRVVMETLGGFSPLVEPVSVDEAYVDLAGTQSLWGPPRQAALAIKRAVKEATGLTCSVGVAPVRFLAKIASDRDKPDGLTVVEDLEAFLQTVTLREVPGVGPKSLEHFKKMGMSRLVEVRALGLERLERSLGVWGLRLWDLAHGRDQRGVTTEYQAKSVSAEETFAQDIADRELLAAHLLALAQRVGSRLAHSGLAGSVAVLKLKHADFKLVTRRASLPSPTQDTGELYRAALALLQAYAPKGPFRLIGVGMAELVECRSLEGGLFDRERLARSRALTQAEQSIRSRFGEKALTRAGTLSLLGKGRLGGDNEPGSRGK